MTFLNTIIDSEGAAKKSIEDAEKSAQKKVADAESAIQSKEKAHTEKLLKDRETELAGQEKELTMLRDSIVVKGEKLAESIKEKASGNVKKGVDQVLKAFTNH